MWPTAPGISYPNKILMGNWKTTNGLDLRTRFYLNATTQVILLWEFTSRERAVNGCFKKHNSLTTHVGFGPKSSTLRLYASHTEGEQGLLSAGATVQHETSKIHDNMDLMLPQAMESRRCSSREIKPLHEICHQTISEVANIKMSYQWLERAGLHESGEIISCLNTRAMEAQIHHTRQDPRCNGLCKEATETIEHINVSCKHRAPQSSG